MATNCYIAITDVSAPSWLLQIWEALYDTTQSLNIIITSKSMICKILDLFYFFLFLAGMDCKTVNFVIFV